MRFVRVGLGGPGQEVGYRRVRGASCASGGCFLAGGSVVLRVGPSRSGFPFAGWSDAGAAGALPSLAWAQPVIESHSALPFYGQKPLQWKLLGQMPVLVVSPAPWAVWEQSQCCSHSRCHFLVGHPGLCQV